VYLSIYLEQEVWLELDPKGNSFAAGESRSGVQRSEEGEVRDNSFCLLGVGSVSVALRATAFAICLSSKSGFAGAHARLIQFPRPRSVCITVVNKLHTCILRPRRIATAYEGSWLPRWQCLYN
jgi:hypothetical protein